MTLIKVEPAEDNTFQEDSKAEEVDKDVDGVFGPVSVYLRISGFYLGNRRSRLLQFLEIVNCALTKVFLIINVVRYSTIFMVDNEFGGSLMGSISLFLLFSYTAILSIFIHKPICNHFKTFVEMLKLYIAEYSDSKWLSKLKMRIRFLGISGFIADLAYLIIMSEGIHTIFPSLKRHLTPFQNATGITHVYIMLLYGMLLMAVGMTLLSTFILFIIMTYCLKHEFSSYNKSFTHELKKGEENFDEKFDILRKRHEKLCELTEISNEINSHFSALIYGFGIPIICCLLYGIIRRSLPVDDVVFNSWNLVTIVFYMTVVTGMASTLNVGAHEPLQYVFRCDWSQLEYGTLQKITLFVARLSSEKIGYSVYGLFTVERSTVLMVSGTILTYAVVVLQFQPDTDSRCDGICLSVNNLNLTHPCPYT